jgi:hypothetical protein
MVCVRNTLSLYRKKLKLEMRRKVDASNAMALKHECKLVELAMEEVDEPSCQENVGYVRVLTEEHPSHIASKEPMVTTGPSDCAASL